MKIKLQPPVRVFAKPRTKRQDYYVYGDALNSASYNSNVEDKIGSGNSSSGGGGDDYILREGDEIEEADFTYSEGSILFDSTYKLNTAGGIRFTDDEQKEKASIQYDDKKGIVVDSEFHPRYDKLDSKGFPVGERKQMGDEICQWGDFYGQRAVLGNPGFGPEDDVGKGIGTARGGISISGTGTSIYAFGKNPEGNPGCRPGLFIGSYWYEAAQATEYPGDKKRDYGASSGIIEAGADYYKDGEWEAYRGTWKMFYRLHVGSPSGTGHYLDQHQFMVDNGYTIYGYHIASVKLTTQDLICTTIDKVNKLTVENVVSKRITNENEIKSATITTTGLTSETITNTKGITSDTINCKKLTSDSIVGTVTDPSDRNIKTVTGEIDKVDFGDVGTYKFFYNDDEKKNVKIGLMAQDVQAKYPEAVRDVDGNLGIMYNSLVALLVKDSQLKEKRIDELEERISKLEKLLNDGTT